MLRRCIQNACALRYRQQVLTLRRVISGSCFQIHICCWCCCCCAFNNAVVNSFFQVLEYICTERRYKYTELIERNSTERLGVVMFEFYFRFQPCPWDVASEFYLFRGLEETKLSFVTTVRIFIWTFFIFLEKEK